ncbi:putative Bikaverin cluster transcription factor bik5, partial [Seiridium cardinale]
ENKANRRRGTSTEISEYISLYTAPSRDDGTPAVQHLENIKPPLPPETESLAHHENHVPKCQDITPSTSKIQIAPRVRGSFRLPLPNTSLFHLDTTTTSSAVTKARSPSTSSSYPSEGMRSEECISPGDVVQTTLGGDLNLSDLAQYSYSNGRERTSEWRSTSLTDGDGPHERNLSTNLQEELAAADQPGIGDGSTMAGDADRSSRGGSSRNTSRTMVARTSTTDDMLKLKRQAGGWCCKAADGAAIQGSFMDIPEAAETSGGVGVGVQAVGMVAKEGRKKSRIRKWIKCDKSQPCMNCQRHGERCTYEIASDTINVTLESQQRLQERLEKLERLVQDMSLASGASRKDSRSSASGDAVLNRSRKQSSSTEAQDHGVQLYEPNVNYYMNPGHWVNLYDFTEEPRALLRWPYEDRAALNGLGTYQGMPPVLPDNFSQFHLHIKQEDLIHDWFYKHVDPFVRITHAPAYLSEVANFRLGKSTTPREVEALMFALQALTVVTMPSHHVQRLLGRSRRELIQHFKFATEVALERANYMRSRNLFLFCAILNYITFLFECGQCEKASVLLGSAGRIGMRLGFHKDPSLYQYSSWSAEMRRRLWNHFMMLDHPTMNLEGAESAFNLLPWTPRPTNANDDQWPPHRFGTAAKAPPDADGFTDLTFVIIRREQLLLSKEIARLMGIMKPEEMRAFIIESDKTVTSKYLSHKEDGNPMHAVVEGFYRAYHLCIRIFGEELVMKSNPERKKKEDAESILKIQNNMFEALERAEMIATENNWQWLFRWPPPMNSIARLLSTLAQVPEGPDADRAWRQVEVIFRRHNNDEFSLADWPSWRLIEHLCDNAMFAHPTTMHQGNVYATRPTQLQLPVDGASTSTTTGPMPEAHITGLPDFSEVPGPDFDMMPWSEQIQGYENGSGNTRPYSFGDTDNLF